MSPARKRRHVLLVCLALAGVLYRGLIPAGFMPAAGEAARHGELLILCTHGEAGLHRHEGSGAGSPSIEQCPFGAAAGPAVPGAKLLLSFTPELAYFRPDWTAVLKHGTSPRLQPPARAPPALS